MLKKDELDLFRDLVSGEFLNFALVEGFFLGRRAVFVSCVNRKGDEYLITPLAMLLRGVDLEHCLGPGGEGLSRGK